MPVVISSLIPVVAPVKRQVINVTTLANTVHLYGLLGLSSKLYRQRIKLLRPLLGLSQPWQPINGQSAFERPTVWWAGYGLVN